MLCTVTRADISSHSRAMSDRARRNTFHPIRTITSPLLARQDRWRDLDAESMFASDLAICSTIGNMGGANVSAAEGASRLLSLIWLEYRYRDAFDPGRCYGSVL